MIEASDRSWNSPTTLYLARRLQELSSGHRISVLDMGCGDGATMEHLAPYGYALFGYDLVQREDELAEARNRRLRPFFRDSDSYAEHVKVTASERDIPFPDDSFDVVYANQVFEHVRFFDRMLEECARVLRPGGTLLANFPVATYPIEGHLHVPFAHWMPPGDLRVRYLQLWTMLGVLPRWPGEETHSAAKVARRRERYLREGTFYRFINEITSVASYYFASVELETTEFVRAKTDLMIARQHSWDSRLGALVRALDRKGAVSFLVTNGLSAAFCMKNPRPLVVETAAGVRGITASTEADHLTA